MKMYTVPKVRCTETAYSAVASSEIVESNDFTVMTTKRKPVKHKPANGAKVNKNSHEYRFASSSHT
jgi:hypothetical protein